MNVSLGFSGIAGIYQYLLKYTFPETGEKRCYSDIGIPAVLINSLS